MAQHTSATHPNADAFPNIGGPALRALDHAGVRSLAEIARWTERDLAQLHGMGPKAMRLLGEALAAAGLAFRQG